MGEEFARWLEAARPAWPWVAVVAAMFGCGFLAAWLGLRPRLAAAKASEKRAEHLWRHIDCVVEPTVAIDMSPLVAHPSKAKFSARSVIADVRERIASAMAQQNPPDWTDEQLAEVKSMTDRSGWPNYTYQPRGFLPNLRPRRKTREQVEVIAVTPLQIGERIKRIRAKQKEKAA